MFIDYLVKNNLLTTSIFNLYNIHVMFDLNN